MQSNDAHNLPTVMDLEALIGASEPPTEPGAAATAAATVAVWKRNSAAATIAGLMTEARYQANTVRLDWLQRLVIGAANGKYKPKSADLSQVLNVDFATDDILHLEDPVEDFFCDVVPTSVGDGLILTGHWERAAPYTHTLLSAFGSLPEAIARQRALSAAHALLQVSTEIVRRAKIERRCVDLGEPGGTLKLPDTETLKHWARRVRFTPHDLETLGIDRSQVAPFVLKPAQFEAVAKTQPGNSPLDFCPLIESGDDLVVAAPGSISLAVRSHLIFTAKAHGVERALYKRLLIEQQAYTERTLFWPMRALQMEDGPHDLRACVCRFAPGRYVHVIQAGVDFSTFPDKAFGSIIALKEAAAAEIARDIARFWEMLAEQGDCRESMTVVLGGGWGSGVDISIPNDAATPPTGWRLLIMSFADVATLGAAENGKLADLWRIAAQQERLAADGFVFQNMNGMLNLFGAWLQSDGNLLPEHWKDVSPPCFIALPTDSLLEPLKEAASNQDMRSLRFIDGSYKLVQHMDWGGYADPGPLYGSLDDIKARYLLGAVLIGDSPWWISASSASEETDPEFQYNSWKAALHWLERVGPKFRELEPAAFPQRPVLIDIKVASSNAFAPARESADFNPAVASTLTAQTAPPDTVTIEVGESWGLHLQAAGNDAEAVLAARIVEEVARLSGVELASARAMEIVRDAIPSPDWRWMHAHPADTPWELMVSAGLVSDFHPVPLSSVALAKCGGVWRFRNRQDGHVISGEDACRSFLHDYLSNISGGLIGDIRKYDRRALVLAAAATYQAARRDQMSWRQSIRAMRTIHGPGADAAAFARQNAINAAMRCAKVVVEVAACEGAEVGGVSVANEDLDELYAQALLWFGNGQILACMRGGLMDPEIRISPAGDLMTDRDAVKKALHPAAEIHNKQALDESAESYVERHRLDAPEPTEKFGWTDDITAAMRSEYGVDGPELMELPYALVELARTRQCGEFSLPRSELLAALRQHGGYAEIDLPKLIDRLTLPCRLNWGAVSVGLKPRDYDVSRFDRPQSLINRPLAALDTSDDPILLIAPMIVADAAAYGVMGLRSGHLQDDFWSSQEARVYAGGQGGKAGDAFERVVVDKFEALEFRTVRGATVQGLLNQAVDEDLGDVDVLAIAPTGRHIFVIEAKNLKFCRTDAEVAARMYEYRGKMRTNERGQQRPDKMLRHLKRVRYLRTHAARLGQQVGLGAPPILIGAVVVDAPQPMNFHTHSDEGGDAQVWMAAVLGERVAAAMR